MPPWLKRAPKRVLVLAVTGVSLYIVAPTLGEVFGAWDQLTDVRVRWFAAGLLLQAGSVLCMSGLQRIAFRFDRWGPIVTSQLAGGAFGRIVPGGGAAAGAFQFGLLSRSGVPSVAIASGLAASSLLSFAVLLALPLLALPGIAMGRDVPSGLAPVLWLGVGLFVVLGSLGSLVLLKGSVIRWVGRTVERVHNRALRWRDPVSGLPDRLTHERETVLAMAGEQWLSALLFATGKWIFDFLTLVTALVAVGSQPPLTLVLLAFCAATVLAQIPMTPGGLGFVEAGLTGTLALAGVDTADAVLATLIYRLFSYWLYLPAGLVAWILHRRAHPEAATSDEPGTLVT